MWQADGRCVTSLSISYHVVRGKAARSTAIWAYVTFEGRTTCRLLVIDGWVVAGRSPFESIDAFNVRMHDEFVGDTS